jgi:flagellar biosynthesis protein FlhB
VGNNDKQEIKAGSVMIKRQDLRAGKLKNMSLSQVVEILFQSELAGMLFQKDKIYINNFIIENRRKDSY